MQPRPISLARRAMASRCCTNTRSHSIHPRLIFHRLARHALTAVHEIEVDGVVEAAFTKVGVLSKIKFAIGSDDPGALPLDFDPRGQVLDVVRAGQVVFSSELASGKSTRHRAPSSSCSRRPVRGQNVVIRQGATVFFERTFPAQ